MNVSELIHEIWHTTAQYIAAFVPNAFVCILILIGGWILSRVISGAIEHTLRRVGFDRFMEPIQAKSFLERIGLRSGPSRTVARIAYWFLLVTTLRVAADAIGLEAVSHGLDAVIGYLPDVLAAAIIVVAGNVVGGVAGRAVAAAAEESGIDYAKTLGRFASGLIVFLSVIFAIAQLDVDMSIVNSVVLIIFAGFALAFALAFGFGARDISRNLVAGFYARKTFRPGDTVEIAGEKGRVKAVHAIVTIIDRDGTDVALPNSVFVDAALRR